MLIWNNDKVRSAITTCDLKNMKIIVARLPYEAFHSPEKSIYFLKGSEVDEYSLSLIDKENMCKDASGLTTPYSSLCLRIKYLAFSTVSKSETERRTSTVRKGTFLKNFKAAKSNAFTLISLTIN